MAKRRKKKESILSPRICWVLIWSQFCSVAINKLHLARLKERATPGFTGLKHEEHRYNGFRGTQPWAKVWLNSPVGAADKMKRGVSTEGSWAKIEQDGCGKAWEQFALEHSLLHFQKETMWALLLGPSAYHSLCACSRGASLGPPTRWTDYINEIPIWTVKRFPYSVAIFCEAGRKCSQQKRIYPVGEYLESSKTHNENLCVSIQEWYWQQLKVIKHAAHWPYKFLLCNNFRETNPCL